MVFQQLANSSLTFCPRGQVLCAHAGSLDTIIALGLGLSKFDIWSLTAVVKPLAGLSYGFDTARTRAGRNAAPGGPIVSIGVLPGILGPEVNKETMYDIGGEILIILVLIVVNGIFALSEMAVITARKSRLQEWIKKGAAR